MRFSVWSSKPSAHISFHDLDVKIRTLVVDVVESTDVIEYTDVKSTDVESTDVVEFTNVVEPTDVGDSSGETC